MPASVLAQSSPYAAARRVERVRITGSLDEARAAWDDLVAIAAASAYQTPEWIGAWLATRGRSIEPMFVIGHDRLGPVALLPLGRTRWGGVAVARFLGGRDANFGLGLFHPDVAWDEPQLSNLLGEAARLGAIDLFWLANQPAALGRHANPLATLPRWESPSLQHEAVLDGPPETVLPRLLSARTRKHLRQKEAKLAALGPVRHERAQNRASAERIVSALLFQRDARFGASGDAAALRAFLLAASESRAGMAPAIELHALTCGAVIVATFAGAAHAGRFSGMMVSFASDDPWARFSPGELLVARIVADKCRDGFERFDLGIGEARYKTSFCPVAVSLFDTVRGASAKGRVAALALRALLATKRRIKRSPRLWAMAHRMRALRGRQSGRRFAA